ncbi:MAG TPA: hypothetical protein VKF42_00345 [Chitinivibrionales bacterium]|nr:hypothetical protein [Chitinivibrionales bacterium]
MLLPSARQDWKNGPAKAGCCLTTARRALVAGSPRPAAETGRTADDVFGGAPRSSLRF